MSVCDNCMNNPKNNPYASGFCNCALPAMERNGWGSKTAKYGETIWFIADRTQTEKKFVTSNFVTEEKKECQHLKKR